MNAPRALPGDVSSSRTIAPVSLVLLGFIGLGLAVIYGQVLLDLVADWRRDENYAHGILIPPAVLWLIWTRRKESGRLVADPSWDGAIVAGFGLALFIVGRAAVDFFLTRFSFVIVLAGLVVAARGWQQLRLWLFPLGLLALAIPLPTLLLNEIAFPLQLLASRMGVALLDVVGVPAFREGNLILLQGAILEVAEACSGVRSLISLVTLALVYGYVNRHSGLVRVALVSAVLPVVVVSNSLRVAGAGFSAHVYGADAARGFLHTFSGWLFFGLSVLVLVAVEQVAASFVARRSSQPSKRGMR